MNIKAALSAFCVTGLAASITTAAPVPGQFTYQGVLEVDGQPAQTDADFMVRLYESPSLITTVSRNAVPFHGLCDL
tara:strand:- start:18451 stop:18678 length:228 start_codon:yes stop_codon:yes gene_type:complete